MVKSGHPELGEGHKLSKEKKRVSVILDEYIHNFPRQYITVGELTDIMADRAFGILMLVFALPNLIPIGIPGISAVLGAPLVILTWQFTLGRKSPWFPHWISERSLSREALKKVLYHCLPPLRWMECILRPRWTWLVHAYIEWLIALVCLLMAVLIILPIPLGNWLPALAIAIFSLAILERDGVFAILGLVVAIASLVLISTIWGVAIHKVLSFW